MDLRGTQILIHRSLEMNCRKSSRTFLMMNIMMTPCYDKKEVKIKPIELRLTLIIFQDLMSLSTSLGLIKYQVKIKKYS